MDFRNAMFRLLVLPHHNGFIKQCQLVNCDFAALHQMKWMSEVYVCINPKGNNMSDCEHPCMSTFQWFYTVISERQPQISKLCK